MATKDIAPVGTDALFEKISALIEESRKRVATAVNMAERLRSKFGPGWGEDVLGNCRKFFATYSQPQISDTACRKFKPPLQSPTSSF